MCPGLLTAVASTPHNSKRAAPRHPPPSAPARPPRPPAHSCQVKSKGCYLRHLGRRELARLREESNEFGGYFICNGIERIIRMLVQVREREREREREHVCACLCMSVSLSFGGSGEVAEVTSG